MFCARTPRWKLITASRPASPAMLTPSVKPPFASIGISGMLMWKLLAADDGHPVRDVQAQSIDAGDGLVDQRDHRVHRRFQQAHQRVERAAEYLLYAFPCLGPVPGEYARDESDQPVEYGLDTFQRWG